MRNEGEAFSFSLSLFFFYSRTKRPAALYLRLSLTVCLHIDDAVYQEGYQNFRKKYINKEDWLGKKKKISTTRVDSAKFSCRPCCLILIKLAKDNPVNQTSHQSQVHKVNLASTSLAAVGEGNQFRCERTGRPAKFLVKNPKKNYKQTNIEPIEPFSSM